MNRAIRRSIRKHAALCLLTIFLFTAGASSAQTTNNNTAMNAARTPTETVRAFYQALHEKRFRDAFALTIYKSAIENLSESEMADLRPDFEKIAVAIPEKFDINGEQISGDVATVFVRLTDSDEATNKPENVALIRAPEGWIVGTKSDQDVVKQSGKEFFFKARIETHHAEAEDMLKRIATAQAVYGAQHGGVFADLPALITAGYIPKDIEGTETTGYRFHIKLQNGNKNYTAGAEPATYGRTGRLSYYLDQSGQIKSKDAKGKEYKP